MRFSHFRGGLKPPLACNGGFTVNGFIPPVDALRHGRPHKPFGICSCEKSAGNWPGICTYKSLDLKSIGINTYKKHWGGVPPLPPCLRCLCLFVCSLTRRFTMSETFPLEGFTHAAEVHSFEGDLGPRGSAAFTLFDIG